MRPLKAVLVSKNRVPGMNSSLQFGETCDRLYSWSEGSAYSPSGKNELVAVRTEFAEPASVAGFENVLPPTPEKVFCMQVEEGEDLHW
jgi:hypothetical protein